MNTVDRNLWPPAHRSTNPQTSVQAEVAITASGQRATLAQRCLWYIVDHPCSTVGEISDGLGLNSWQVSKRLSDLKNQGLIMQSGDKEYAGRRQSKWMQVEYI